MSPRTQAVEHNKSNNPKKKPAAKKKAAGPVKKEVSVCAMDPADAFADRLCMIMVALLPLIDGGGGESRSVTQAFEK